MSNLLTSPSRLGGRAMIAAALMATYMQAVNISLPNAALPHIQGTLSMGNDEVGWIFSSYIAASAVIMPMTPLARGRYGRRTVYLVSLAVFAAGACPEHAGDDVASVRAGARIIQGAASGPLGPARWRSCSMWCHRSVMRGPASHGRRVSCSASAAGRASAGWLSEYQRLALDLLCLACRWRLSLVW